MWHAVVRWRAAGPFLLVPLIAVACQDEGSITPLAPIGAVAGGAQPDLLTIVEPRSLTGDQQRLLSMIQARPTSAEVHVARLASGPAFLLQKGREVGLRVSPTARFVAIGEQAEERLSGSVSWAGTLRRQPGQVRLVLSSAGVTGTIETDTIFYWIEPIGGGLHAIIRFDPTKLPPDHSPDALLPAPDVNDSAAGLPLDTAPGDVNPAPSVTAASTGTTIDVLVVYTPAAASAVGSIADLIQLSIDQTNASYSNSSINANVNLVHTAQVSYSETGRTFDQHVAALTNPSDGLMDGAHALRNEHLADVVVLLVNDTDGGSVCGMASLPILATASSAFAASDYSCAAGPSRYTFAHEIGHLQGARHDRAADGSNQPFQYGHGYVAPNRAWRTIMAYPDACGGCVRILYWSNPNITYSDGQAMGTPTYENNAQVLNETAFTIANFRRWPVVTIHGPTVVNGISENCSWLALGQGGVPPYTIEWTGVLTGTGDVIYGAPQESGYLGANLYDAYGRGAGDALFITVDRWAPPCEG